MQAWRQPDPEEKAYQMWNRANSWHLVLQGQQLGAHGRNIQYRSWIFMLGSIERLGGGAVGQIFSKRFIYKVLDNYVICCSS